MDELTKEDKISLLAAYLSILPPRWSAQQNYIAMYFTIVIAVFGFAASQVVVLLKNDMPIILCLPLLIAALISWFSRRSISKQEKHIRELIVVTAKLEHSLRMHENLIAPIDLKPWSDDEHLLPAAWVKSRLHSGNLSERFIQQEIGGTSGIAATIFLVFAVSGIALAALAVLAQFGLLSQSPP